MSEDEEMQAAEDLASLLDVGQMKRGYDAAIEEYPEKLPLLPLTNRVYMPAMTVPFMIEPGMYYNMLKEVSKMPNKFLGLVLTKNKDQDIYKLDFDDLYEVGVVARVLRILTIREAAGAQLILNIEKRFRIKKPVSKVKGKYLVAAVEYHREEISKEQEDVVKAYASSIIKTIRELVALQPVFKEELKLVLSHSEFTQASKLCDFAVALTTASRDELQEILSTFDLVKRMQKALVILKKECDINKLQAAINQKIETNLTKTQRDFFLREQLRTIQKELGLSKDDKQCDIDKFRDKAKRLKFTLEAEKVFNDELEKLGVLEIQSAEYSVVRGYLDMLTSLPWGIRDKEKKKLSEAAAVLEKDHYGLKDVKERILEYLSVGFLKKKGTRGYLLCLVGPPGVGKTSIGKSIARALGRKFFRFSVGGMKDEAEIKGHRRTYVGAMPGKILQALKQTGVQNPVLMIDEIDKIGTGNQGDPASALLEVLDPEQNKDFLDHYLDVRFDLSEVLFIVTANTIDTIPAPLLDRMEIIRLSGYVEEEKLEIAKKYLIPKDRKEIGLTSKDLLFRKEAIQEIIHSYCREAGVRHLEKCINKIMRKIAMQKVKELEEGKKGWKQKEVSKESVEKYLGKPYFSSERFYGEEALHGVATGLAWTALGGSLLYIEAVKNQGKERLLKITGNAGEIMKESSNIAFTYLLSKQKDYLSPEVDLNHQELHVHIPEGAVPKDGPSAGITITTALISLLTGKAVPSDLAMTGELTLTGKVLPIGGLKEKILAAKRASIHHIICPKENQKDWEELPSFLKKGISMHFVEDYKEVHNLVFGETKWL